jgi:hypothetical protein
MVQKYFPGGDLGGTMRLGAYECHLTPGSKVHEIYKNSIISERHRHRYEVNTTYLEELKKCGLYMWEPQLMDFYLKLRNGKIILGLWQSSFIQNLSHGPSGLILYLHPLLKLLFTKTVLFKRNDDDSSRKNWLLEIGNDLPLP